MDLKGSYRYFDMEKRRVIWHIEDDNGNKLAHGVLYDEGNVQVYWRKDHGWTAEQYASICQILGLMEGVAMLVIEKEGV